MKKLLLGVAFSLFALADANASDLPLPAYKAAPVMPFSWVGFYFGGSVGGAWGNDTDGDSLSVTRRAVATNVASDSFSASLPGFVSGAQVGYNFMQFGPILLGGEADIYASSQEGTGSFTFMTRPLTGVTDSISDHVNAFGTLRGRVGYIMNNWLFYGTAGLAWQHMNWNETASAPNGLGIVAGQGSATRFGWTAGGGAELALSNNWLARAQYLYIDTGTLNAATQIVPGVNVTQSIHTSNNVVTMGLNYKF